MHCDSVIVQTWRWNVSEHGDAIEGSEVVLGGELNWGRLEGGHSKEYHYLSCYINSLFTFNYWNGIWVDQTWNVSHVELPICGWSIWTHARRWNYCLKLTENCKNQRWLDVRWSIFIGCYIRCYLIIITWRNTEGWLNSICCCDDGVVDKIWEMGDADGISKNPSVCWKHPGVPDCSASSDETSYHLMENLTLPVAQATGHVAYLPPLLRARNAVTYAHHQNDPCVTLFAWDAVML